LKNLTCVAWLAVADAAVPSVAGNVCAQFPSAVATLAGGTSAMRLAGWSSGGSLSVSFRVPCGPPDVSELPSANETVARALSALPVLGDSNSISRTTLVFGPTFGSPHVKVETAGTPSGLQSAVVGLTFVKTTAGKTSTLSVTCVADVFSVVNTTLNIPCLTVLSLEVSVVGAIAKLSIA
jgi:hypothetical protein